MALHGPLSLAGLEIELDALSSTYAALETQQGALQKIITQHNVSSFLPTNLEAQTRQATYIQGIDKTIIETFLFVGIIASFQKFIKVLVSDILTHHTQTSARFSDISSGIREAYLVAAAGTYRFKKSGSVRGVRVNFHRVEQSLKECLNDTEDFTLEGEAITSEMGNPSQAAIENIFGSLGLSSPFNNDFGGRLRELGWSEGTSDGDNTRKALAMLSRNIERRNDAVHGMSKVVFGPNEFTDILEFFRKFATSLFDQINNGF
ncbi:HEPN domain-containing protein [Qipengyuania sp. DSG2-2]|uniref:HEPN domain-containing protein n=1 Tax=Qipengyuania sp. DGS2-2 TaxID=3349631 RepID=UPI0036D24AFE